LICIQEYDNLNSMNSKIKYYLNIIDVKIKNNIILYRVPLLKNKRISKIRLKIISKKLIKKIKKNDENIVILSNFLKKNTYIYDDILKNKIEIINGKRLFYFLVLDILDYIFRLKNEKIEQKEITILINNFDYISKKIIFKIAQKVKKTRIITNDINTCNNIEKELYDEYGILIDISNNIETSLINSKIILNFDFSNSEINNYKIFNKAIIINLIGNIIIHSKRFNGININHYQIDIPEKYKIDKFSNQDLYEGIVFNFNFEQVQDKIREDKIRIISLIGNRGVINKKEFY